MDAKIPASVNACAKAATFPSRVVTSPSNVSKDVATFVYGTLATVMNALEAVTGATYGAQRPYGEDDLRLPGGHVGNTGMRVDLLSDPRNRLCWNQYRLWTDRKTSSL